MPSVETRTRMTTGFVGPGRIALSCAVALLAAVNAFAAEPLCPAARPKHLDLPATRAAIANDRIVTIVALGSSSTEGVGATVPERTYPARLDALLHMKWPGVNVTVQNKGIGGQMVDAVLARLDADVLDTRPTLVIWQVGTNEALHGLDPAHFAALLDDGLRRLAAIGSDVILMDYQIAPRMPPREKRRQYRAIIAREAKSHAVSLFSRAGLMRQWQATDPTLSDMIAPDGLHQSDRGYACLAASLGSAIVAAASPQIAAAKVK